MPRPLFNKEPRMGPPPFDKGGLKPPFKPPFNEKFRMQYLFKIGYKPINMTCTCAMQTGLIKATACTTPQLGRCNHSQSFVLSLEPGFPLSQAMIMPMPSSMLGVQQAMLSELRCQ